MARCLKSEVHLLDQRLQKIQAVDQHSNSKEELIIFSLSSTFFWTVCFTLPNFPRLSLAFFKFKGGRSALAVGDFTIGGLTGVEDPESILRSDILNISSYNGTEN